MVKNVSKIDISQGCARCGVSYNLHRHHVTYNPPHLALLCFKCHKAITFINTVAAKMFGTHKKYKTKMTNVVRLALWGEFIKGNRKGF
jgi:hypothetical protein